MTDWSSFFSDHVNFMIDVPIEKWVCQTIIRKSAREIIFGIEISKHLLQTHQVQTSSGEHRPVTHFQTSPSLLILFCPPFLEKRRADPGFTFCWLSRYQCDRIRIDPTIFELIYQYWYISTINPHGCWLTPHFWWWTTFSCETVTRFCGVRRSVKDLIREKEVRRISPLEMRLETVDFYEILR